jgi:hypothetical protein
MDSACAPNRGFFKAFSLGFNKSDTIPIDEALVATVSVASERTPGRIRHGVEMIYN